MASERQNMSEQDISIKAREHELYHVEVNSNPVKPFPVYLRETPAAPFSRLTIAILWVVGTLVALLFLAALWRVSRAHGPKPLTETTQAASDTTMLINTY